MLVHVWVQHACHGRLSRLCKALGMPVFEAPCNAYGSPKTNGPIDECSPARREWKRALRSPKMNLGQLTEMLAKKCVNSAKKRERCRTGWPL